MLAHELGHVVPKTGSRPSPTTPWTADQRTIAVAASLASAGAPLPHLGRIQRAFGPHNVTGVRTQTGGDAGEMASQLGTRGFALGDRIGFRQPPDLRLAAHEIAHVVQAHAGLQRDGPGDDPFERSAAAIAEAVVSGRSAVPLLDSAPRGLGTVGLDPDPLSMATYDDQAQMCIAPVTPPPLPQCLPSGLDLEIPQIRPGGAPESTLKQRIEFEDEILDSPSVVLYAVPRWAVDVVHDGSRGVCEPGEDLESAPTSQLPFGPVTTAPVSPFTPAVVPQWHPPQPQEAQVSRPLFEALALRGDYAITTRYTTLAVGAGSVRVVRTKNGVSLIDAGVGPHAHSEITAEVMKQLELLIGDAPINEVLLSHLHEDHTSLLPELAAKFGIGTIRVNAYQLQDPRMVQVLVDAARRQARRIGEQVRDQASPTRSAWETDPKTGVLQLDPTTREARWDEHVDRLVETELAKSAIRLETLFVNKAGELHVVKSPILGELVLPKTGSAPVLLERGLLETDTPSGTRISTARPKIAQDLDALIKKQVAAAAANPHGKIPRASNESIDANETTYIIEFKGGFRLFVSPDKRAPDLKSMEPPLRADVARLNVELARLGRKPAELHAWDLGHHAQKGFVTGTGEMRTLIESLSALTRVKRASGHMTTDIVIVSGHIDPTNPAATLVDPLTVWLLNELKIEVYVAANKQSVDLLEVVLGPQKTIAGVTQDPYRTGIVSKGLLRRSHAALDAVERSITELLATRPQRKGTPAAEFRQKTGEINTQVQSLRQLRHQIIKARDAYLEYYESKLRPPDPGKSAPGMASDDPIATARHTALETLLTDERVKVAATDAPSGDPKFDPVALTLLKQPPGGIGEEQRQIAEAILRVDALRETLRTTDTIETRAEFAKELTALKPMLSKYAETVPEATKELLQHELTNINTELAQVTKPIGGAPGDVATVTTPDGTVVEQRTRFTKADRVRQIADLTTRPMGAIMIYSMVKKKEGVTQQYLDEQIDLPEYLIGTVHTAYGVIVGVRMLNKMHVSNTEFVVLAVLDVVETSSHQYATDAERNASITYSLIRNGLQVGLEFVGGAMMRSGNAFVAAAGFGLQFAVDPFLEWVGLYDWLERKYDFLPDDVARSRQEIKKLMKEYTVLIGLLELADRPTPNEPLKTKIAEEVHDYREKVTAKERDLLKAFGGGYDEAKTAWAGLPELDIMREQFVQLQFRAHTGDTEHVAESRKQILESMQSTEAKLSLDAMSAEEIRKMEQWDMIDSRIGVLRMIGSWLNRKPRSVDWAKIRKHESELTQMMDNARYRLDPTVGGLRHSPLLTPGSEARAAYEQQLSIREASVARMHELLLGVERSDPALSPTDATIIQAERLVAQYAANLAVVPPFQGLTAQRMHENSYDLAKTYVTYVDDHGDYRRALEKLQVAELAMQSAGAHMNMVVAPMMSEPVSSFLRTRAEGIQAAMAAQLTERVKRGFLYPDEAKQRAIELRQLENRAVAAKFGEKDAPSLSSAARTAIIERDLKVSTVGTVVDRLNAMPMLSRVGAGGYMDSIYRYVDRHTPESENALVGDLRRKAKVPGQVDEKIEVHLYVPLNASADKLWGKGHWFMHGDPIIGRSVFADVPPGTLAFDDDEIENNFKRVRFEELKP